MTPSPQVERIHSLEEDRVVEILIDALWNIPCMAFSFEGLDPGTTKRRLGHGMRTVARAALAWGTVLGARVDGELHGVAIAYPPGAWPLSFFRWLRSGIGFVRVGPRPFVRLARYDGFLNRIHPHEPHWYLYFLAVSPERQHRGLGSAIFARLRSLAAENGVPVLLETDKESNVDFYLANGCTLDAERRVAVLGGMPLWCLRVPAPD